MNHPGIFNYVLVFFLLYYCGQFLYSLFWGVLGWVQTSRRMRQRRGDDFDILSGSVFTFPVSILLPAHNEAACIMDSVRSLERLNYPEWEVIVIDDGSTDGTLDVLKRELDLKSLDRPYVDRFDSGAIRGMFISRKDEKVRVLSKESGKKKAGALNAGLNLARYKFICVLDADTILETDALQKVMSQVHRDPDRVIACGSYFGLLNGFTVKDGRVVKRNFLQKPVVAYQNLEYIRAFVGNRLAWSAFDAMLIVSGGFGIWRRDVLNEMGGFSEKYSSEDLEVTLRGHEYIKKRGSDERIMMLPYQVGWTLGPRNAKELIRQRNRWQRVKNESMVTYRHMLLNPSYRALGLLVLPYYFFYEVLGVIFEVVSIGILIAGIVLGHVEWQIFFPFALLIILAQAVISLISLLIFNHHQLFSLIETFYMIGLSFLELFWYHWVTAIGKIGGFILFFKGVTTHDKALQD